MSVSGSLWHPKHIHFADVGRARASVTVLHSTKSVRARAPALDHWCRIMASGVLDEEDAETSGHFLPIGPIAAYCLLSTCSSDRMK